MKKYVAEAFGTFVLVLGGCGNAVLAAASQGRSGPVRLQLTSGRVAAGHPAPGRKPKQLGGYASPGRGPSLKNLVSESTKRYFRRPLQPVVMNSPTSQCHQRNANQDTNEVFFQFIFQIVVKVIYESPKRTHKITLSQTRPEAFSVSDSQR